MKKIMRHNRKGFVLVLSLLTTTILLALVIPYVSRVVTDYRLTSKIYNSTAALDLAEVGIERALWEINWGPNKAQFESTGYITGWVQSTDGAANPSPVSTSNNNIFQTGGMSPQTIGYYDVTVLKDQHKTYDINTNKTYITATGYVPNRIVKDGKRVIRFVYAKYNFSNAFGACGNTVGAITLGTQDKIDSYNSAQGTYTQTHTNSNGNLATNGSIVFGTQAKVYGDAHPGANFPFPSKPSGVSGAWGTLAAPLVFDPVPRDYLDGLKNGSNNNGNIQKGNINDPNPLNGYAFSLGTQKTATLTGGADNDHPAIYHFTSLTLGTQTVLNVTGPSTIYVDSGNITVGTQADFNITAGKATKIVLDGGNMIVDTQGDVNNYGVPKNLMIYSTGSIVSLTTQTDFYGAIYAPNADVTLTTQGEIFGSISSKTIHCGTQAALHFDLDLLNVSPVFESNGVSSWQETQ